MDAAPNEKSQRLTQNLGELKALYEAMLALLREERDLLLGASDLEGLKAVTARKEEIIRKIQLTDLVRQKLAAELGAALGVQNEAPRLLELAPLLPLVEKARLVNLYDVLQKVIKESSSLNQDNALLAHGALAALDGAMNDIKQTVVGKPVYGGRGQYKQGSDTAGHFVRKEA